MNFIPHPWQVAGLVASIDSILRLLCVLPLREAMRLYKRLHIEEGFLAKATAFDETSTKKLLEEICKSYQTHRVSFKQCNSGRNESCFRLSGKW